MITEKLNRSVTWIAMVILGLVCYSYISNNRAPRTFEEIQTNSLRIVDKEGRTRGTFGMNGDAISLQLKSIDHMTLIDLTVSHQDHIQMQMSKRTSPADTNWQTFAFSTLPPNDMVFQVTQAPSSLFLRSRDSKMELEFIDQDGKVAWKLPENE